MDMKITKVAKVFKTYDGQEYTRRKNGRWECPPYIIINKGIFQSKLEAAYRKQIRKKKKIN